MTDKTDKAYRLKNLEFALKITERETAHETVVVTTPSMWAKADDYRDSLRAKGGHTSMWYVTRFMVYLSMQAAASAGLIPAFKGIPSTEAQAEFTNVYDVDDVTEDYNREAAEGGEDPTEAVQEGGQEAE